MKAEIVAVGTELLLGQIANTNAQSISRALAPIGVDIHFHTVVGDNIQRMTEVIATALNRADAVIVTGGLGPTPDDITRAAIAGAVNRSLVRDEELARKIADFFARRGREMPADNLRQADLPQGATVIEAEGTAPGFMVEEGERVVFALPGVPWEMEAMLAKAVVPELARRAGGGSIVSRELLVVGLGESHVHEQIADLVADQSNPTIAYLAGGGQVRVRLTAKAAGEGEAQAAIEPVEAEIRTRLGKAVAEGSHTSAASALADVLLERGLSVATAESLTGGGIGAELTRRAGASEYFLGGVVCYSLQAKREVAGIPAELLDSVGPASEEVAGALAEAAVRLFGADLGLSATGVAGPDEHGGRPAGTVFVGARFRDRTEVRAVTGYGGRENIRAIAANSALDLGRRVVSAGG